MNSYKEPVSSSSPDQKRQLGFATGQVEMVEGWERPMTDAEADAFLAGRLVERRSG